MNPTTVIVPPADPPGNHPADGTPVRPTDERRVGGVKAGRNRAVDLYRAVAMFAVAIGHWLVMVAYRDGSGELVSGNALEFVPGFRIATWAFQVMPLFFVVGGFASAASLDSRGLGHSTDAAGRATWISGRLARLLPPVSALAAVWLVAIGAGYLTGLDALVNAGAIAAAIPLWFLANYVADVILAPHVLPLFRRSPGRVAAAGLGIFLTLEIVRVSGALQAYGPLQHLPHVNWILGWFLFQMAGFAWRDGLLPTGRDLVAWGIGFTAALTALVTIGPWPISMVNYPGLEHSPTHPPTIALLLFGAAQSAFALAMAPAITRFLERNTTAWTAVIAANSMAMTIYLWHMTAGVIVLATFDALGVLGGAAPGTAAWWLGKMPFVAAAMVVLAVVVPRLAGIERRALLTRRPDWTGSPTTLITAAVVVSTALKGWTTGSIIVIVPSLVLVVGLTTWLERELRRSRGREARRCRHTVR